MSDQDTPQNNDEPTPEALSATEADENPKTHTEVPNRDESDETACAHCGHPIARVDGQWVHTPQREREKFASWCRTPAIRATAQPGSSNEFFEHFKPGSFRATQIDMEYAARTIDRTARAAQRVRDAEAELAAAREAEVAIRAVRRGSLGPDEALKLALDLIGRRTDIVAVQLPEPTSTRYEGPDHEPADRPGWWEHGSLWGVSQWGYPNQVQLAFNGEPFEPLSSDEARFLAAALLAAANVADAAEDGGK